MKKKLVITLTVLIFSLILIITLITVFIFQQPILTQGSRKAIILASANDFYRKEGNPEFNEGNDSKFNEENNNWTTDTFTNMFGAVDSTSPGYDGLPGVLRVFAAGSGYGNFEFVFNWTDFYPLYESTAYYLSAWINITTISGGPAMIGSPNGVRIGLRWLNSSNNVVRIDWSTGLFETLTGWTFLEVTGINNNTIGYEITKLQLVLSVEGIMTGNEMILIDDVRVEHWFPPPIPTPIPSNIDSDGFPAQALQVYWILKNHGYIDENILLMLYHTGDDIIDIYASDGIANDLNRSGILASVDVENDDVNASRFKQELNVSVQDSFASGIKSNDQLVIYMVDHGSNKILGDGNATFHFESDDSYITELEFINLVRLINCKRILINIDICFSGNFLSQGSNIGLDWYSIPKSILITSTTDILSWYWRDNNNPDGFAGSWFFHQFWEQLDQNMTIGDAFTNAKNSIPLGQVKTIDTIQSPLIQDNLGISNTWSFNSNPPL